MLKTFETIKKVNFESVYENKHKYNLKSMQYYTGVFDLVKLPPITDILRNNRCINLDTSVRALKTNDSVKESIELIYGLNNSGITVKKDFLYYALAFRFFRGFYGELVAKNFLNDVLGLNTVYASAYDDLNNHIDLICDNRFGIDVKLYSNKSNKVYNKIRDANKLITLNNGSKVLKAGFIMRYNIKTGNIDLKTNKNGIEAILDGFEINGGK